MSTIHTKKMNRTKVWTSQSKSIAAFTLVELLTVIAIIAILSAIIFPVYNNSREAARRTTAVSNLAKIQNAMEQYKLDHRNRDYPPVLFAYADGTHSMADIKNVGSAESWAAAHPGVAYPLQGLYPQYINDASVFTDPNNTGVKDTDTVSAAVNVLGPDGTLAPAGTNASFYKADAYDVGPRIVSDSAIDNTTFVTRYQRAWTSTASGAQFQRQLDQPTAPNDTYVTMTTYHVPQSKVVVLFLTGSAKVFDASKVLGAGCGPDSSDITASGGVANAGFWHIKPSGSCQ